MKTLALILALAFAAPAFAGECHISYAVPVVTNFTIATAPGRIVIDADLATRPDGWPPAATYNDTDPKSYASWGVFFRVNGGVVDLPQVATVTDSTFHAEVPYQAGTYEYYVCVDGYTVGEPQLCHCAYEFTGTLTVVDPTPARRASLGAVLHRWAR